MKKTLITLAALAVASVAQAADTTTIDDLKDNLVLEGWNLGTKSEYMGTTFSGTDKAFTMTLAIDWDIAVSSGNGKTIVYTDGSYQNWFSNSLTLNVSEAGLSVGLNINVNGDMVNSGTTETFSKEDYCVDGYLKLNYTFDGDQTFTLSVMKNDAAGTIVTKTFTNSESWANNTNLPGFDDIIIGKDRSQAWTEQFTGVEHILVFNTDLTTDAELRAAAKYIPEPTTATLSLLALAGLAARRRRK